MSATPPQLKEIVGWVFEHEHGDWRCEDCSVFTKLISFQRSWLGALYDSATVDPCSYNRLAEKDVQHPAIAESTMSRNRDYSQPGSNGGYTNGYGNGGYGDDGGGRPSGERRQRPGGYGGMGAPPDDDRRRPSNDRQRRPPGYGGMGAPQDDYGRRPSGESQRERRPGGYGGFTRREDEYARPQSGGRDRRPGGYGGLQQQEEDGPEVTRPTSLERSRANRRSGERQTGSRGANNYGSGSQRIEDVLQYIRQNWDFMTQDQCVPIEVALKLMDSSSLGLASQYGQFKTTHRELQQALKAIVNAKPELKEFATASQNYDGMLQMLNAIEELQLVPEQLEARISEKRFLTAVDILQKALLMIRKTEMEKIGALNDLRTYLSNQEVSLTDILIEELHSHLYLKSPYCEDRWKEYAQNQMKGGISERTQTDARGRLLYYFLDGLDLSEPMTDDSTHNPETDTFQYIRLIVESLNKMNRLEVAVNTIEQRLPVELFKVVDKSNNEVAQRHPSILRAHASKKGGKAKTGIESDEVRSMLLNDLLWTLYARFEAIAESHRAVHDVVAGIVRREGLRDSSSAALTRGFKELWKLYQSEIRSLLHDYLATDGDALYRTGQGQTSAGSVFSRAPRDKTKRMFKLSDMNTKSPDIAQEREDLEFILKSSVPGLVSDSKKSENRVAETSTNLDGSATGHKLLVEPSVFNMGILLPPSLDFLNRLKEVVPPNSDIVMSTLTSFLDDFLVNVFQPQLDETLAEMSSQTFIELDSFSEDPHWEQHAKKPIFKCNGWYKALVTRSQPATSGRRLKAPAAWSESEEMERLVSQILQSDPSDSENFNQLVENEISLLLQVVSEEPLDQADMLQDKKSVINLCLLYTSMKWLATKAAQLRHISDRATNSGGGESSKDRHTQRWTLLTSSEPRAEGTHVYLPLNRETVSEFDQVVSSYQSLSTRILRTLHLTIRSTILHALSTSLQPNLFIDTPLNDPSPIILALNSTLVNFDTEVSRYSPQATYTRMTHGLANLMDTYLLSLCTSRIARMNTNGCAHMQLNILVLQQNLKNVEEGAELPNAALFFDLFTAGPDAIVARAKQHGKDFGVPGGMLNESSVKKLLEMTYEERLTGDNRESSVSAKRQLDAQLLEISEFMY
ncbi:hypothetical protein SNOG_09116 [Parastagonospora nodorum SN15]|uniref:Exocyst complex component Sec8 n=1 Tax=Phaeosphaeria nodorum (strain SN15 / ATCC MYA-4574 / FGSC 10173) TaxID=321614 RepID=Q0UGJ8_PHANO|nr:hypothetical protein SNOG_09116 [Parastagonospora nodorum SN15]EAT83308.2 hypothetical protein SNOG_09116 [Parastagonospora nodorum SN15]